MNTKSIEHVLLSLYYFTWISASLAQLAERQSHNYSIVSSEGRQFEPAVEQFFYFCNPHQMLVLHLS